MRTATLAAALLLLATAAAAQPAGSPTAAPFTEDSTVTYVSCDSIRLAATLALPAGGAARHPAVVLLSGTGRQTRDCVMAGRPLFRVLSDSLAARGVAVLRSDDRGTGRSTGHYEAATTADFAADALAAVAYLRSRADIDPRRIGLVGHSEGGAAACIAAAQSSDIAFVASLSGMMADGLASVVQQNHDLVEAAPLAPDDKARYHDINGRLFRTAHRYAQSDSLRDKLYATYDAWRADSANSHIRYAIHMYAATACTPWYRHMIRYNPADHLPRLRCPVLLVGGEKDAMVNPQLHIGTARRLLAHNPDVTARVFPGINHILLPCQRGTPDEYASIAEPLSADVLHLVAEWVAARARAQRPLKAARLHKARSANAALPPGNYSGIASLGDGRYALADDAAAEEGFRIAAIDIDTLSGRIRRIADLGYRGSGRPNPDTEGVALLPASGTLLVCNESGNTVRELRPDGTPTGRESGNLLPGAARNRGLEGLAYDPLRHTVWVAEEQGEGGVSRLLALDDTLRPIAAYAYPLDPATATRRRPRHHARGVSALCALPDGTLLALEREAVVPRRGIGARTRCRIYQLTLPTAPGTDPAPRVEKRLVAEWTTRLNLTRRTFGNYEGLCAGPRLADGRQTLVAVADSQNRHKHVLRDLFKTIVIE